MCSRFPIRVIALLIVSMVACHYSELAAQSHTHVYMSQDDGQWHFPIAIDSIADIDVSYDQRFLQVNLKASQTVPFYIEQIDSVTFEDEPSEETKDHYQVFPLYITTADGSEITSRDYYTPCHLSLGGLGAFSDYSGTGGIRGRGNSSFLWYDKKPFRIKLDHQHKILGLKKAKSWVLLANYRDVTDMMNTFVFEMGEALGLPYTNHTRYVELFVNGDYRGIYQLTERVQRNKNLTALNDYLNRILAGDESMEIESMEEGELSILKTNLFKVMTLLMHQRAYLKDEKIHLANAIADISHQLKTPLTSLMMMNDLLENESDEEKRRELLATQSGSLDRMNWLIQTLLKISKLDAKCVELKKDAILTKDLVDKATEPFLLSMEQGGIRYVNLLGDGSIEAAKVKEKNTEDNTESREESVAERSGERNIITCDINWTTEAIQNIVKNCVEHMKEGDTLTISGEETTLYTAIRITDTGCGIDAEDLPHIFERFYRGKNSSSNSVGIGLALARTIIEEQKGEIAVASKVGKGSAFTIKFYKSIV